ncbi:pentatricopeptide repeat-containing protein At1g77405 [Magnolia sinica]|uniref:pentatricopeptide repeat-containing protein At1g77405 n=1 Tax=Magnolia sinica TaxID=86752 RepID=UPI00265A2755|nr:pentatricopeptide repeat-containing protein At1g77405 [Magnolia sinica]
MATVGSLLKRSRVRHFCNLLLQQRPHVSLRSQPLTSSPDNAEHRCSLTAPMNPTLSNPQSREAFVRQVMDAMLQDRPFDGTSGCFRRVWTVDAVREVLRAVPMLFFQSARSVGRQKGFRRRSPLKQRDLRQEAEGSRNGLRLGGPAAYRDPVRVEQGVDRAMEFFSWVESECGFVHVEATCREMAYVLAKGNSLKKLWQFLREMAGRSGNLLTTATLTCVIKFLGEEGLVKEALAAFYRMKQFHCKPDVVAYNTIICALCRVGFFKKARFLLDQMEMPGSRCPPDTFTYTILIGFYCKHSLQTGCRKAIRRRLWEANHLFRDMLFKGFVPDVVTFNCLIDGLCKTYRIGRALELFDDMLQKGLTPNRVTYNSFIRYYSAVNEIDKAIVMMSSMRSRNHGIPTSSSYTPIIHALCEARRPLEARDLLVEMVDGGSVPRDYTYKLVRDALSLAAEASLPDDLCQRIEDGISNRYQHVMRVKPMMANKGGILHGET